jgi:hypothetical protein
LKTTLEVKSKSEGEALKRGLGDPVTRATATVVGVLLGVPEHQRVRVLRNVNEALADDAQGGAA